MIHQDDLAWLRSGLFAFSLIQDADNNHFVIFAKTFASFAVNSSAPLFSFLINKWSYRYIRTKGHIPGNHV